MDNSFHTWHYFVSMLSTQDYVSRLMLCLMCVASISSEIFCDILYHILQLFVSYIDGILQKGPYPPCLHMADRALLAGYPWYFLWLWDEGWPLSILNESLGRSAAKTLVRFQMSGHPKYRSHTFWDSLWPSEAILRHRSGSTLTQVMAWCLTVWSHYLNQCWLLISEVM